MKVEISKEQKAALGNKISLCVEFLKQEVQPHLISSDKVIVPMGEILDLCITSKKIYVVKTRILSLFTDIYLRQTLTLEKKDRKDSKKYICDRYPELAVDFLKHWEEAKNRLIKEVIDKNKKINDLNSFVDQFVL